MPTDVIIRVAVALAAMALVLVGLRLLLKLAGHLWQRGRLSLPGRARLLDIVETRFLPGAASLHVVSAQGRRYLIGRTAAAVSLLAELPLEGNSEGAGSSPSVGRIGAGARTG